MYSNLVVVALVVVAALLAVAAAQISLGAPGAHPGLAYSSSARAQISRAGLVYGPGLIY